MRNLPSMPITKFLRESNRIEGYDFPEADYLVSFAKVRGDKPGHRHVDNSVAAFKYVLKISKRGIEITDILKLHKLQMKGLMHNRSEEGAFRTGLVSVGGDVAPKAEVIPYMLDSLVDELNSSQDPLKAHYEFERIHPFWDGNGRTGRLVWAWHMLHIGEHVAPILSFYGVEHEALDSFTIRRAAYYHGIRAYKAYTAGCGG